MPTRWGLVGLVLITLVSLSVFHPAPAAAAPSCAAFTSAASDRLNVKTQAQLLSNKSAEVQSFAAKGFTSTRGAPFTVAEKAGTGLSGVHRFTTASNGNVFYSADPAEIKVLQAHRGLKDEGVAFYASLTPATCLIPVYSFLKGGIHRFSTTPGERAILRDAGWKVEKARFYVGPPKTDSTFVIGVLPDTQQEVLRAGDTRFIARSQWLVSSKSSLDLKFVTHTGDIVNWDTPDHIQYVRAAAGLKPLETAKIPYSLSPGNHDTEAVCEGGGACDPHQTRALVRQTNSFNRYLNHGTQAVEGRFEANKVDNTYSIFSGGGESWMMLNLELWPRPEVLTWARKVVASHPDTNVIVATHSYLVASGGIYNSGAYGGVSPQSLWNNLIKVYPNVRMVLCGHAGKAAARTDTGVNGNRIITMMLTMHDVKTNPIRLIEVNTAAGSADSWVYSPYTNTTYPTYSKHWLGMSYVR
ncbi:MAG: metallophosphoesterase [Propionibacteriaceae bacterium]